MKQWSKAWIILMPFLFAACSKDASLVGQEGDDVVGVRAAMPAYVSIWETGYDWNGKDSSDYRVFTHRRGTEILTPDVLERGAVLVFVRNYQDLSSRRNGSPVLAPFHVLPPHGRPGYDQKWYHENAPGYIEVKYRTNKQKYGEAPQLPDGLVQFRYVVITGAELDRLGYSRQTIKHLEYAQLLQLLGAAE